jgi:hypothetical protein
MIRQQRNGMTISQLSDDIRLSAEALVSNGNGLEKHHAVITASERRSI